MKPISQPRSRARNTVVTLLHSDRSSRVGYTGESLSFPVSRGANNIILGYCTLVAITLVRSLSKSFIILQTRTRYAFSTFTMSHCYLRPHQSTFQCRALALLPPSPPLHLISIDKDSMSTCANRIYTAVDSMYFMHEHPYDNANPILTSF